MSLDFISLTLSLSLITVLVTAPWLVVHVRSNGRSPVLHYLSKMGSLEIADSYRKCLIVLLSACGAGLITAASVALKIWTVHLPFPDALAGILISINFVASFLLMQAFGFRLATKQSPLLGATLGKRWSELSLGNSKKDFLIRQWRLGRLSHVYMDRQWRKRARKNRVLSEKWLKDLFWTIRTQASSATGNLLAVALTAYFIEWIIRELLGTSILSKRSAEELLTSFNPWESSSLFYAAFTGVLIWICSFTSTWISSRYQPFSKTTAVLLFNISLGTLLAVTPYVANYLDLTLEVRHFTLSGGAIVLAMMSLGIKSALASGLLASAAGVLAIGLLNFLVSFLLAFATASFSVRKRTLTRILTLDSVTAHSIPRPLFVSLSQMEATRSEIRA